MTEDADEHERTMAFAEIALGQIKALRQAATPRNYEIWYAYATGYHPSLNQKINETLKSSGVLAEDQSGEHLRDLSVADAADGADRRGRQPGQGRDRAGDVDDRHRRRFRQQLHREPGRHVRKDRPVEGPRGPAHHRRKPGAHRQGDGTLQHKTGRAAQRIQAGNPRPACQPRGGAQRKPDRPPDPALPTANSSTPRWKRPSPTRAPRTRRCRCC